jgi:ELWxxDGT repeat protein
VGETLFFTIEQHGIAHELWKSDGTPQGTVLVRDLGVAFVVQEFTDVDGTLFFVSGREDWEPFRVWKSDGTAKGTVIVKDGFYAAEDESGPRNLVELNGTLYFIARDDEQGEQLWRSDGTAGGTYEVLDVVPGPGYWAGVQSLFAANGLLYLNAYNDESGAELWKSDGTAGGTSRVADIVPGPMGSFPTAVTAADGFVYFTVTESGLGDYWRGMQLWSSDGTAAGTRRVTDVTVEGHHYQQPSLIYVNGTLLFGSTDSRDTGLWKTDGTAEGTVLVRPVSGSQGAGSPQLFRLVGDQLFFTGTDAAHGSELWVLSRPDGDLNGDFGVDRRDLAILARNFGMQSGAAREQGDLNGDGRIDLRDVLRWRHQYLDDHEPPAPSAAPESRLASSARAERVVVDAAIVELTETGASRPVTALRARRASMRGPGPSSSSETDSGSAPMVASRQSSWGTRNRT